MGRIAARMLINAIRDGMADIQHVVLRPELVVRKSTQAKGRPTLPSS
jgi:DNA-binding LacI/PurR family transcriptional regulator